MREGIVLDPRCFGGQELIILGIRVVMTHVGIFVNNTKS